MYAYISITHKKPIKVGIGGPPELNKLAARVVRSVRSRKARPKQSHLFDSM
jgi:hypothetical protein